MRYRLHFSNCIWLPLRLNACLIYSALYSVPSVWWFGVLLNSADGGEVWRRRRRRCAVHSVMKGKFHSGLTCQCAKETNRPVANVTNIVSDMMNGFFILCAVQWTLSFVVLIRHSVYRSITAEVLVLSIFTWMRMCYRNGEFFIFGFDWIYIYIAYIKHNFDVCCCSAHRKGNVAYVSFI